MAYYHDEIAGENVFEGIPCEFCEKLYPFEDIVIHETGCDDNPVNVAEPLGIDHFTAQDIRTEASSKIDFQIDENLKKFLEAPVEKEKVSLPKEKTPVLEEITPVKKDIPKKEQIVKDVFPEYEILQDHLLDNETFTFASGKNKEKKIEKETPSFKKPPIPVLNNNEMKCFIQNDLPDSDNEENESLEKFWKKAEIKLAQRLRALEKKKVP